MSGGLIHVAGIRDTEEAELLIDCGIEYLGFPLVLDHHTEDLSPDEAAKIVAKYRGQATFFVITYLSQAVKIADLCRQLHVDMVQLHGNISHAELRRLRAEQPGWRVIKSLVVTEDNTDTLIEETQRLAHWVDAFITDTFDPVTGARGATGKTHDWAVSRRLVEVSPKPVILAGGLNPDNVSEAIRMVRPAGVDVHTGIEGKDGRKRRDLTSRFVTQARKAFAEID